MRFTVALAPLAEQHLAAAWLASDDRPAVTVAAHRLEQLLAIDPMHTGESRVSSVNRVHHIAPLGFMFDVVVDDATVFVTAIWLVS